MIKRTLHVKLNEAKFQDYLYTWREFCIAIIIATIIILLSGCAQLGIVRAAVDARGQEIADRVLADTEFILCRGITIGAWGRRYGRDATLAEGWKTICGSDLLLATPR